MVTVVITKEILHFTFVMEWECMHSFRRTHYTVGIRAQLRHQCNWSDLPQRFYHPSLISKGTWKSGEIRYMWCQWNSPYEGLLIVPSLFDFLCFCFTLSHGHTVVTIRLEQPRVWLMLLIILHNIWLTNLLLIFLVDINTLTKQF